MTREEIASYLGLKLETVSRLFSSLQENGLLQVQGRAVKLLDVPRLRQEVAARALITARGRISPSWRCRLPTPCTPGCPLAVLQLRHEHLLGVGLALELGRPTSLNDGPTFLVEMSWQFMQPLAFSRSACA
jgi:hypothetical protein